MNAIQESKLGMYHAVLTHLDANDAIVATIPAFKNAVDSFRTTVTAITQTVQQQLRSTTGVAVNKSAGKKILVSLAATMANTLYAYASDKGDIILKEKARVSRSTFQRSRDEELAPRSRNILELILVHAGALKDYGITPESITAFQAAVANYSSAIPAPRNVVAERTAYREKLEQLFKKAGSILNDRIGKLIALFLADHPDFVGIYFASRTIVNPSRTVTQLRGTVINKETGKPINAAIVEIPVLNIIVKTNTKGNFIIKPLARGVYDVKISREAFELQVIKEINIVLGHINRQQVYLVPNHP